MRIVLCIIHKYPDMRERSVGYGIVPPVGLGYIASFLLKYGHQVKIIDDCIMTSMQIKDSIENFHPDIVGFYTYSFAINSCLLWAKIIKEINQNIKIIFGGPHATHLPHETLHSNYVDIVVRGEGEETITEVTNAFGREESLEAIKGVVFKDKSETVIDNGQRPLITDLDSLPFPAHELLNMDRYRSNPTRRFSTRKFGTVTTLRGCSYRCIFCSQTFGKEVRYRSPENVVDELEFLIKQYGVGELRFLDDDFAINPERSIRICDLIIKRGFDLIWNCNCKVNNASVELFKAMSKAGCKGVLIGVESASQETLDFMKKDITVEQIRTGVRLAKEIIGFVNCTFMLGFPGDTVEKARQTIKFAKELNPEFAFFSIAHPMPGSDLFKEAVKKGLVDTGNTKWDGCTIMLSSKVPVLVEFSEISAKELIKLRKMAFREFYLRPRYILNLLYKLNKMLFKNASQYFSGVFMIFSYQVKKLNIFTKH